MFWKWATGGASAMWKNCDETRGRLRKIAPESAVMTSVVVRAGERCSGEGGERMRRRR